MIGVLAGIEFSQAGKELFVMDPSLLDFNHGVRFAAMVRQLFFSPVASSSPDEASSFWLRFFQSVEILTEQ